MSSSGQPIYHTPADVRAIPRERWEDWLSSDGVPVAEFAPECASTVDTIVRATVRRIAAERWHAHGFASSSPHAVSVVDAVGDAMRAGVPDSLGSQPAGRAALSARADEPERDSAQTVAGDGRVGLAETYATDAGSVERERMMRLRRWQRQP